MHVDVRPGTLSIEAHGFAPDGAFTAHSPDGDEIGSVTCVLWDRLAWIGGLVTRPPNEATGRALLQQAVDFARGRGAASLGAHATPDERALFDAAGFRAQGESALWTRTGRAPRAPTAPSGEYAIYPVSSCEIMELLAYDRPRFGASRGRYLAALIAQKPHQSFVAIHRKSGMFAGHVLALPDRIGPLVADAPEAAEWLLYACEKAGTPPRALVAEWNQRAVELFQSAGYTRGGSRARMMLGEPPAERAADIYAIGAWDVG